MRHVLLLAVGVLGCGGASAERLVDGRLPAWARTPTVAESLTLRSHYDRASPYRNCMTMSADMTAREGGGEETVLPMRVGLTSRLTARAVGEAFEITSAFGLSLAEAQRDGGATAGDVVLHVDARNRPIEPPPVIPETPNTEVGEFTDVRLPMWPSFSLLSPAWPEEALQPGATFVVVERPVRREPGIPTSTGHLTTRWTYLGLTEDRSQARLRCEGTFDWRFAGVRPDGAHMAGDSEGRFDCEVTIDVATGVLGRGRLIAESTGATIGGDTPDVHARSTYSASVTVDAVVIPGDATDPICEEAESRIAAQPTVD